MVTLNDNYNNLKLWSQYIAQTTYLNESNYNFKPRNVPKQEWRTIYRDVLKGLNQASIQGKEEIMTAPTAQAKSEKINMLAIIEIYTVYCFHRLTIIFGDVPYTEATSPTNNLAKYDDAATIQADLDRRLVAAIATISPGDKSFDPGYENLFEGNMPMWIKFANGLRLKMALTTAKLDPTNSETIFNEVKDNLLAINESASFGFLVGLPNTNPMWEDLINSGRDDYVVCETIVDTMNSLNDPRRSYYFQFPDTGITEYVGGVYGQSNTFSKLSHLSEYFTDPTQPAILMDGVEMAFYLAEAAHRGWGGDTKTNYDAAITQSIINWGGTAAQAQAYLAQTEVAYSEAGGWNQLGFQEWLAYFNRGLMGWTAYRKFDITGHNGVKGDDLMNQAYNTTDLTPKRLSYPIIEQTLNGVNYNAAASKIGGDRVDNPLWWDKK